MILWPRLPLPRARALAETYTGRSVQELTPEQWPESATAIFAPTGGMPVDKPTMRMMRRDLEKIAQEAGFPSPTSQKSNSQFDEDVVRLLGDCPIGFGEGIRAETWAWMCVVLVPHLVKWRWPDREGKLRIERFAGPLVRNCLGRLWYQSFALDRGEEHAERWGLLDYFGADQVVALLERPSLAANRDISLAVAEYWSGLPERQRREELFRQAMKALLVRAGVQRLDVLGPVGLTRTVDECFGVTMQRLGIA